MSDPTQIVLNLKAQPSVEQRLMMRFLQTSTSAFPTFFHHPYQGNFLIKTDNKATTKKSCRLILKQKLSGTSHCKKFHLCPQQLRQSKSNLIFIRMRASKSREVEGRKRRAGELFLSSEGDFIGSIRDEMKFN